MHDRPTAEELVAAVSHWLERELLLLAFVMGDEQVEAFVRAGAKRCHPGEDFTGTALRLGFTCLYHDITSPSVSTYQVPESPGYLGLPEPIRPFQGGDPACTV